MNPSIPIKHFLGDLCETGGFKTLLMNPNDNEGSTVMRSINDEAVIAGFYGATTAHGFLLADNNFVPFDVTRAGGGTVLF